MVIVGPIKCIDSKLLAFGLDLVPKKVYFYRSLGDKLEKLLESGAQNLTQLILQMGSIGSFLGGLATFLGYFAKQKVMKSSTKKRVSVIGGILLLISAALFAAWSFGDKSLNETLVAKSWTEFNNSNYESAINRADECIDTFGPSADREQKSLEDRQLPMPKIGSVTEEQKQEIFARGLLNDAATCYYIKGFSEIKLDRIEAAKATLKKTTVFTYARTWDKRGWFWSPAETAQDLLTEELPK